MGSKDEKCDAWADYKGCRLLADALRLTYVGRTCPSAHTKAPKLPLDETVHGVLRLEATQNNTKSCVCGLEPRAVHQCHGRGSGATSRVCTHRSGRSRH